MGAMRVSEKAIMTNAVEPVRQDMQQEPADKLMGVERHELGFAAMTIITPEERDLVVGHADKPRIGDRNAVGAAGEIGQHLFRSAEGWLGINDPLDTADPGNMAPESGRLCQFGKVAEEIQPAGVKGRLQFLQKQPAKQPRQDSNRQEKAGPAGDPARAAGR